MAADARHNAQAAWFVRRWSYMRQAKQCEKLVAEALRQLRSQLVGSGRIMGTGAEKSDGERSLC
jgi:hypothetical protein